MRQPKTKPQDECDTGLSREAHFVLETPFMFDLANKEAPWPRLVEAGFKMGEKCINKDSDETLS